MTSLGTITLDAGGFMFILCLVGVLCYWTGVLTGRPRPEPETPRDRQAIRHGVLWGFASARAALDRPIRSNEDVHDVVASVRRFMDQAENTMKGPPEPPPARKVLSR